MTDSEPSTYELRREIQDIKDAIQRLETKFERVPVQLATHEERITTLQGSVASHTAFIFSSLVAAVVALIGVVWQYLTGARTT